MTWQNAFFRASLITALTTMSWFFPGIGPVIGFVSSVFCTLNNFIFPPLFHLLIRRKVEQSPKASSKKTCLRKMLSLIVVISGLFVMSFGVQGPLMQLLHSKVTQQAEPCW